jgi:hypothetical protein
MHNPQTLGFRISSSIPAQAWYPPFPPLGER